ncbi:MAG: hypothetical protein EBS42_02080 [Caulobacteraceae bacterium]|nr:hypothetical protein [Caulobacteraceae bacterium]
MLSRNSLGLRLAGYLSLILLFGPLMAMTIVWGVAALGGTTPQRVEILALGDKVLVGLLCLGAIGLAAEFLLLPMVLRDRK